MKVIEKAALSLPREAQQQLLVFLTAVVREESAAPVSGITKSAEPAGDHLHPDLLAIVGIIPAEAEAEEIHEYRLLKHS
ncbi:MAG: hypothetical protein ACREIB_04730 [Pseudomonadota bacterium]